MSEITFELELSESSINELIKQVKDLQKEANKKVNEFTERLATVGAQVASRGFATAIYDGVKDVQVTVEKTAKGHDVVATGEAVAFLEFGAGVYHNPGEPYPIPRPEGVVGIGQFGKGKGKSKAWGYYPNGQPPASITHGNPATLAMYNAGQAIEQNFSLVAKEVFR